MTSDVKKAAEEYAFKQHGDPNGPYLPIMLAQIETTKTHFLAGDAHGFARAVKLLEDAGYVEHPKTGKCIAAREWAAWLKEQEKGE